MTDLAVDDEATAPSEKLQPSQKVEADIESSTQDNPEETAQESPSLLHDGNVSPRYQGCSPLQCHPLMKR